MEPKSNEEKPKFTVYPLVPIDNKGTFNIADRTLIYIWDRIEAEGKVKELFYDGHVRTIQDWLNFIKAPGVYPIIICKGEKIVHIAWLKDCFDACAWTHHVAIGKYQRGVWEAVLNYWKGIDALKLLLGLTPSTNEKAVKLVKKICKFTVVGEIPWVCNLAYEGKRVPGVVSYLEL